MYMCISYASTTLPVLSGFLTVAGNLHDNAMHITIAGGHCAEDATTWKIWQSGLWWPTTKKDAHDYCKQCDLFQRIDQPTEKDCMPHQPILPLEPFQKWGLDLVATNT